MARTNITVPDEVLARARAQGLNVSGLATAALSEELDRRTRVAALDEYLAQLEDELGPVPPAEAAAAKAWADELENQLPGSSTSRRAG